MADTCCMLGMKNIDALTWGTLTGVLRRIQVDRVTAT